MPSLRGQVSGNTLFALRAYGSAKIGATGAVAPYGSERPACRGSHITPPNLYHSISTWLGGECLFAPESIVTRPRLVEPPKSLD
jgi:hypothetical protein